MEGQVSITISTNIQWFGRYTIHLDIRPTLRIGMSGEGDILKYVPNRETRTLYHGCAQGKR
jgi:hypothetical protein